MKFRCFRFNWIAYLCSGLIAVVSLNVFSKPAETVGKIEPPHGFVRIDSEPGSFTQFLRGLPLKSDHKIRLYNGEVLPADSYNIFAVLDVPLLFDEDLEQCADFAMRLWADYKRHSKTLKELALFDFNGRPRLFAKSQRSYRDYLRWHMQYSNSYSIKQGANRVVDLSNVSAGDMFVQNNSDGGIGHVSMVLDQAENSFGHKLYLVGYSFMPAQEFHIERSDTKYGIGGWFTAEGYQRYAETVFGSFGRARVMRF